MVKTISHKTLPMDYIVADACLAVINKYLFALIFDRIWDDFEGHFLELTEQPWDNVKSAIIQQTLSRHFGVINMKFGDWLKVTNLVCLFVGVHV